MDSAFWRTLCQRGLKTAFFSSELYKLRQNDSFVPSDFFRTQMGHQWGCQETIRVLESSLPTESKALLGVLSSMSSLYLGLLLPSKRVFL